MWCRPDASTGAPGAGVRFTETEARIKDSWVNLALVSAGLKPNATKERRRHIRLRRTLAATVTTPSDSSAVAGRILDLGVGGCLFEGGIDPRVRVPVKLTIGPLDDLPSLSLTGRTVHSQQRSRWGAVSLGLAGLGGAPNMAVQLGDVNTWKVGIQFERLSDALAEQLHIYLARLAEDLKRRRTDDIASDPT
ncbi:MAG TPA: PilZ domain-containing protein [Candidatus Xenobia bacterium]